MKQRFLEFATYPLPLRCVLFRRIVRGFSLLCYQDRVAIGAVDRPQYAYCIFQAAKLAYALRYPAISVLEFGCAGGNGLLCAEKHIKEVQKIFPIEIPLYGFDAGEGLPELKDYRDLPYWFQAGFYPMDRRSLQDKITFAKLVLGNVTETCAKFFDEYKPAPIDCMSPLFNIALVHRARKSG
jgi:hypothetical protein